MDKYNFRLVFYMGLKLAHRLTTDNSLRVFKDKLLT
jgi:hypothetical protein